VFVTKNPTSLTRSEEKNILERPFALKRCHLPTVQEFTCPHRLGLLSERGVGMRAAFLSPLGDISRKQQTAVCNIFNFYLSLGNVCCGALRRILFCEESLERTKRVLCRYPHNIRELVKPKVSCAFENLKTRPSAIL
jgi:hypothetical protein